MWIPYNFKTGIAVSLILFIFGLYLASLRYEDKSHFPKITGRITYLANAYKQLPTTHKGKMRYLALDTYPYIVELFVGKDFTDFSPAIEKIDSLKLGDQVTLYYEDTNQISSGGVNRSVQFIEKEGQVYFREGNKTYYIGFCSMLGSVLFLMVTIYLKKAGKLK